MDCESRPVTLCYLRRSDAKGVCCILSANASVMPSTSKRGHMSKLNINDLDREFHLSSPKGAYENKRSSLTEKFAELDTEQRRAPFDIEVVTLPPGKKDWPYHVHATGWEVYIAIEGVARMRIDGNYIDMMPGDSIQCAPGAAHQIINESESPFIYWLVSSSPTFDTSYYPDSDKLTVRQVLGAPSSELGASATGETTWTKFRQGATGDYWEGEE